MTKRIIVGISGASGVQLGIAVLKALRTFDDVETHLVVSKGAKVIIDRECDVTLEQVEALADVVHDNHNLAATISSGSFCTDGMIVAPCSMKSLSAIANAYDDDLLVRAADVCRKEGRKVVLIPREMPLNQAHLRNLLRVAEDGYVVCPPMLTFYNGCKTTDDQVDHVVGKVLMQFGLEFDRFRPWEG
ncbi:MAG: UbiX family flavin prenyltransferase [Atopobiaceae bacterium]|nr:UbiX family flavin prenyltransferase [Atopobiaceae bacterium]MBR1829893.1 UbiX family flavin prenyltransferase [Atopobiaceae bacterium]